METDHDWFSSDRPISNRAEDKLGRRTFADAIAGAVGGWRGKDSLVLALLGPWGVGKSSIKNMVIDALRAEEHPRAVIAEFNPWEFANREQLTEAFFDQVGIAVGRGAAGSKKNRRRLLRQWQRYASYLKSGSGLLAALRIPLSAILALPIAFLLGFAVADLRWLALLFAAILAGFVALGTWSWKVAAAIVGFIEPQAEIGRQTLEEVKDELASELKGMNTPLLVVLDDIDRLTPSEALEMLQLVKANADFPNLVYLLLFDRPVLENSIEKALQAPGREYLEKMVQVAFDVPAIERPRLSKVLFDGLNQLLADEVVSRRFDQRRWGNLFLGGLQLYFETLRDVNRFLSTLSLHVAVFRGKGSFEVNPVDLIGLEVLRVFEPDVYWAVASSKEALVPRITNTRNEERRKSVEALIAKAPEERRARVREIVKQIFPTIEGTLGGTSYGSDWAEEWYRDLRVCSFDVFDRYFHFSIPEGDISQTALDRILDATADRGKLRSELLSLGDLLPTALQRLEAYKERLPPEHAEHVVTAFFDVGDRLPSERGGFEISPEMHAVRIIYWYLRREPDTNQRFRILREAIRATEGLRLPLRYVSLEDQSHKDPHEQEKALVLAEQLPELKDLCVQKIRAVATESRLSESQDLRRILYIWREWAGDVEPKRFCEQLAQTPDGAVFTVKVFLSRATSHGLSDYVGREHVYISLGELELFVPWETIEEKLRGIAKGSLAEDDERAIAAFRKAVARRRDGKPDITGPLHGEEDVTEER